MKNVTEYLFQSPHWRVMVRSSQASTEATDLAEIARDYADGMGLFLDADNTSIGSEESGPHGGTVVRITSKLPGYDFHAGLLKFANGEIVELSLIANKNAKGAQAEFERLLASVRSNGHDAIMSVSRALKAANLTSQDYPAGPLHINLSADYQTPREFVLESADGAERYTFGKRTDQDLQAARSRVRGAILAESLAQDIGEDGQIVKYEVTDLPRFSRPRTSRAAVPVIPLKELSFGIVHPLSINTVDSADDPSVTVRFEGARATAEKAAELLRLLNTDK